MHIQCSIIVKSVISVQLTSTVRIRDSFMENVKIVFIIVKIITGMYK
jgi:hypothetical protein